MSDKLRMNVLVAARDEYSQQLINLILPHVRDLFQNLFDSIQNNKEIPSHKKFYKFQESLKGIPKWNAVQIEQETVKILKDIPYLLDLVTAVFVTNVKILACVRIGGKSKNLNVNIPSKENFIHKVIIECAESFYYDPLVFDTRGSHNTIQDKKIQMNKILDQSIRDSISKMLPISEILQEYLIGNLQDIDSDSDNESENNDSDDDEADNNLEYNVSDHEEDISEKCNIEDDSSSDEDESGESEVKTVTMSNAKPNQFSNNPKPFLPEPNESLPEPNSSEPNSFEPKNDKEDLF